jgi:hypothetical protein
MSGDSAAHDDGTTSRGVFLQRLGARQSLERGEFRIEPHNGLDLVVGDLHFVTAPLSTPCRPD